MCSRRFERALLARSEVALLGSHLVAPVVAIEINRAERSVVFKIGRRIGERILAAQFGGDVLEAVGKVLDRRREEDFAAGLFGELLQNLISASAARRPVGD